jgi:hypothetical protein
MSECENFTEHDRALVNEVLHGFKHLLDAIDAMIAAHEDCDGCDACDVPAGIQWTLKCFRQRLLTDFNGSGGWDETGLEDEEDQLPPPHVRTSRN